MGTALFAIDAVVAALCMKKINKYNKLIVYCVTKLIDLQKGYRSTI